MGIAYRKNELEQKMLSNLHKKNWTVGLKLPAFEKGCQQTAETMDVMTFLHPILVKAYTFIAYGQANGIIQ